MQLTLRLVFKKKKKITQAEIIEVSICLFQFEIRCRITTNVISGVIFLTYHVKFPKTCGRESTKNKSRMENIQQENSNLNTCKKNHDCQNYMVRN